MRVWWRRELPRRWRASGAIFSRIHGLQPPVVSQRPVRITLGGGQITNPGRYLVLLPPINGATAFSGTPYFTAAPGDKFKAWDGSATFDYMPSQFTTFRLEVNHRAANVPYFSGPGGVTPAGGNSGLPGSFVSGLTPDLRKIENRLTFAVLVKL